MTDHKPRARRMALEASCAAMALAVGLTAGGAARADAMDELVAAAKAGGPAHHDRAAARLVRLRRA